MSGRRSWTEWDDRDIWDFSSIDGLHSKNCANIKRELKLQGNAADNSCLMCLGTLGMTSKLIFLYGIARNFVFYTGHLGRTRLSARMGEPVSGRGSLWERVHVKSWEYNEMDLSETIYTCWRWMEFFLNWYSEGWSPIGSTRHCGH
jgi:hypothetical protein